MSGTTDVFVVGGGPAGLSAAIAASLKGLRVAVADRRIPPIDKACGEGIMPDGVEVLARLGVHLPLGAFVPFRGVRFHEGGVVATGRFRSGTGLGVRRTVFHDALVRRAEQLGVELYWGTGVRGLHPEGVTLDGGLYRSRFVVGADGRESRIRREIGLDAPAISQRIGLRRHYHVPAWSDFVEVYWSNGCEAYVTPVARCLVCIAMLVDDPKLRFDAALRRFPRLQERLTGARPQARDLGSATEFRRNHEAVRGRVALVGEAAGSLDAITGDGITVALHQAEALASALRQEDLECYATGFRKLMRVPYTMTSLLLSIDRRPRLRRRVLQGLAHMPFVFSRLLALHTRATSPGRTQVLAR